MQRTAWSYSFITIPQYIFFRSQDWKLFLFSLPRTFSIILIIVVRFWRLKTVPAQKAINVIRWCPASVFQFDKHGLWTRNQYDVMHRDQWRCIDFVNGPLWLTGQRTHYPFCTSWREPDKKFSGDPKMMPSALQRVCHLSKHETFTECRFNVGPASKTVGQHWNEVGWTSRVCRDFTLNVHYQRPKTPQVLVSHIYDITVWAVLCIFDADAACRILNETVVIVR